MPVLTTFSTLKKNLLIENVWIQIFLERLFIWYTKKKFSPVPSFSTSRLNKWDAFMNSSPRNTLNEGDEVLNCSTCVHTSFTFCTFSMIKFKKYFPRNQYRMLIKTEKCFRSRHEHVSVKCKYSPFTFCQSTRKRWFLLTSPCALFSKLFNTINNSCLLSSLRLCCWHR